MAHIDKRRTSKGEWRYEVRYRDPHGKERSRTFPTRKRADRYAREVEVAKDHGIWVNPSAGRESLDDYAARWLAQRAKLRPRTRETYEAQLRLHLRPTLGAIELSKITPSVVRAWHSELIRSGLGANTVAKCYRLLHAIFATAVEDELVARTPCVIKGAGIERSAERPVATVDQVWAVADAIEPRLKCLVLLAGFTGLRLGELLGLECRHVDPLHKLLVIEQQEQQLRNGALVIGPPKSDAGRRTIALPAFLVAELERHLAGIGVMAPNGRVFTGERGGPLRRHVVQKYWESARRDAGLPVGFRFHDLRHTANTITAASGASTRELMHRMGHASPAAALRYQHATRDRDVALAAALGDLVARAGNANGEAIPGGA